MAAPSEERGWPHVAVPRFAAHQRSSSRHVPFTQSWQCVSLPPGNEVHVGVRRKIGLTPFPLLAQPPPMRDPTVAAAPLKRGIFICGEYGSVPGIQWAMLSGRHAAEAVLREFGEI